MCTALHLPEPAISGETITAEVLAERISRYLVQHPYTRTLCINVFNPGHATTLAQALLLLQKQEAFASLRYDVRFFVADPAASHIGDALETLLTPNTATSTEVTDAFSTPGSSHLFPKLSLAVHARSAFDETPQRYRAHLSILFDLFRREEIEEDAQVSAIALRRLIEGAASMHGEAEFGKEMAAARRREGVSYLGARGGIWREQGFQRVSDMRGCRVGHEEAHVVAQRSERLLLLKQQ